MSGLGEAYRKLRAKVNTRRPGPAAGPRLERVRVSILVVSYNGAPHLRRLLESIGQTRGVAYELVVVDNASGRATKRLLVDQQASGRVNSLTLLDRNTLFAPGVNTAFRVSNPDSDYVLLLNPDITVLHPDWLSRLLAVHTSGATSLGYVEGHPWTRADGYCLLVDRDLFAAHGGLSNDFHWWWAVTKLQADLLRGGHAVQAVADHSDVLHHVGGGSGRPPLNAKGMQIDEDTVRGWFDGRNVRVLPVLPA